MFLASWCEVKSHLFSPLVSRLSLTLIFQSKVSVQAQGRIQVSSFTGCSQSSCFLLPRGPDIRASSRGHLQPPGPPRCHPDCGHKMTALRFLGPFSTAALPSQGWDKPPLPKRWSFYVLLSTRSSARFSELKKVTQMCSKSSEKN